MAVCPQCKKSYPPEVRLCPADGTSLSVSAVTPKIDVNAVGQTAVAQNTPAPVQPPKSVPTHHATQVRASKTPAPQPARAPLPMPAIGGGQTMAAKTPAPRPAGGPAVNAAPAPVFQEDSGPINLNDSDPASSAKATPAPTGDAEMALGTQVGEYQVTCKLGEGGMGTVFGAVHPLIGKKVAIKVLNPGLSQDDTIVQRFIQEARSVNQIGHRNIVDIFAFGQLPSGRQYFVMEHLHGKSLKERLDEGPLPYAEAFTILLEVGDALSAAHAEGIVHRDLKPDNIFLTQSKRGGVRTVKLLDFGIAKLLRAEEGGAAIQQTRTGTSMGTPLFMSPEQCLGKPVDARTDIYSIGVIMFELFTGQLPFPGPSYIETVNGHISQPPPNPGELADLPASLSALILHCMEKDQTKRPQSIDEVRATINQVAAEMGSTNRHTSGQHSNLGSVTPVRKTPVPPSSVAAPVPTPVPAADPSAPIPLAPPPRRPAVTYALVALGVGAVVVAAAVMLKPSKAPPAADAVPRVSLQVLSEPAGAAVIIEGKRQALRTPSVFDVAFAHELKVRVEAPEYAPYEEVVKLHDGETAFAMMASLKPLHVAGGHLQVRSNALQATWTIDGKPAGDGSSMLNVQELAPGDHLLRVEAKGFDPREATITIQSRQLASFEWNLVPTGHGHHDAKTVKPKPVTAHSTTGEDDNATSGWHP